MRTLEAAAFLLIQDIKMIDEAKNSFRLQLLIRFCRTACLEQDHAAPETASGA